VTGELLGSVENMASALLFQKKIKITCSIISVDKRETSIEAVVHPSIAAGCYRGNAGMGKH